MDGGQEQDCYGRVWEMWAAAAATGLPSVAVQAHMRQLRTEARLQHLACCMPGANWLTVIITARILTQYQLFT
jgi:hypothetical protein